MPRVAFDRLPDHARLWVFGASRPLDATERAALLDSVDAFLDQWTAHGAPLTCGRDLRYDRFLLVAVDEAAAGASGCSIDALVRSLRAQEAATGMSWLDNAPVTYKDGDDVRRVPRPAFAALAEQGAVGPETVVFNNMVSDLGAVRRGHWETPAKQSWHARAFFGGGPPERRAG